MSELRFTTPDSTSSELYSSPVEATPFTTGDQLDLQRKSKLGTPDEGRQFALEARAAIEEALRRELPHVPTREEASRLGARSIKQANIYTMHLRHEKSASRTPEEIAEEKARFDLWEEDFTENPIAWADAPDEPTDTTGQDLNANGYELTGSRR